MGVLRSEDADGKMVRFELSAGVHALTEGPMHFDGSVRASEVSIVGSAGAVIRVPVTSERRRLSTDNGAIQAAIVLSTRLMIQLEGVTFQGGAASFGVSAVVVESGDLEMSNCTVRDVQGARAIHAFGGGATIRSSLFEANLAGAIAASSGSHVLIRDSFLRHNAAENGGALAVAGGQTAVTAVATHIAHNSAKAKGGALHVEDGRVILALNTLLEHNIAVEGAAMYLSGGSTVFALPAPPGRWVNTAVETEVPTVQPGLKTLVSTVALGSNDEDYPFACPPGTVGGTDIKTQLSPVCVGACPAGSMCASATHTPQRAPLM